MSAIELFRDLANLLPNQCVMLLSEPNAWLISLSVGVSTYIAYAIARFYVSRRNYPPGPFPLPLLGNLLQIRGHGHLFEKLLNFRKQYGPVFTIYLGYQPNVIICDLEQAFQAFKLTDFSGRPHVKFAKILHGEVGTDLILADYGREWEVLRRVTHSAVRKYAMSSRLATLVADVVDEVVEIVKKEPNKAFEASEFTYLTIYNILAQSAYGTRYSVHDKEFLALKANNTRSLELVPIIFIIELMPFMKLFYRTKYAESCKLAISFREHCKLKYCEHLDTYQEGQIRDFSDALIFAKKEAEAEQSDSAQYLNDSNLALVLLDLFSAGSDTSKFTLQWALLFMANYPGIQRRLRAEIDEIVGDRIVTIEDKSRLDYVQAFICETLRYRPVAPLGIGHTTTCEVELAGKTLKNKTAVGVHLWSILHDPGHWLEPEKFWPDRFLTLSDGKLSSRQAFIPFGIGRRACPGEKLAQADLLFIICRLLQATRGQMFELEGGPGSVDLNGDSSVMTSLMPNQFKLVLRNSD